MKLSEKAEQELIELGTAEGLKKDMEMLRSQWQSPFVKDGLVDIVEYSVNKQN